MIISDVSIKRPVFATMLMVALVVLGIIGYQRLAIDEYPDITYPIVVTQTAYPGASPEVVMRDLSKPIEEALNTVQGIKEVTSTSLEGSSLVRLQFNLDVNVIAAQQEVSTKVARIRRQLPPNIEDPIVLRFDPNDRPIISVAMTSAERPLRELSDIATEVIKTRFESIPGVGGANISGAATRQIQIQLDADAMRAYNIAPPVVIAALERENREVPAGRVRRNGREQLIRVTGRVVDPARFADITLTVRNGAPVRISDVATVVDGSAEQRSAAFVGRTPAVAIEVQKIAGSNTVEVADRVREMMAELERTLPADVKLSVIRDDSQRIRDSLESVQHELILGAVLCIVIIYFFLNSWRSTIITGLALPISLISSFFVMWAFNFTLNTMTLLALSLAIGLLIDDAIVVRENIVRHLEMGKDHEHAASEGTSEIGLAVFATTMAVVAVFFPVAFMGGMIGKIFFQFGVTVAFAVLVSLFVSFTLDPMLSSVWHDPEVDKHNQAALRASRNPIRRVAFAFNDWFERVADRYPAGLAWALGNRVIVLGAALMTVVASVMLVPKLGFTWMPDVDGSEFNVNYRVAPGSAIDYTIGRGQEIAKLLEKRPEVVSTYLNIGGGFRGSPSGGSVAVKLVPKDQRTLSQAEVQTVLRPMLMKIPGVRPNITGTPTIFGGYRQPIEVKVQGPEPTRLKLAAAEVLKTMSTVTGIAEPNSSDDGEIPQLDVQVDREQAWAAGLGIGTIASTLQPLFTGQRATRWEDPQGYSHDVVVIYPDSLRRSSDDVAELPVPGSGIDSRTGLTTTIPLGSVATIRAGVGPQAIERSSLERQVSISAGVLPGFGVGDVAAKVKVALDSMGLPAGYRAVFGGDVQNLNETKGYVGEALILAVVFIYLILASLFGSFLQPLAIMLSLPLSFIGVAIALLATKGSLNVMTMIGIIMLLGLVTKNGILLVDFANQRRAEGDDVRTALLAAGRIRLRPIIMTTVAMIAGMLPLAFALGAGAEQRAPMGRAVIGGLITSTLLTLFVVPSVYSLLDDLVIALRKRFTSPAQRPVPTAMPAPVAGD
ncbi:MAG: efflux RND transporter permease subunit [Gemmatimonadaceae bacterium]|nr:efflux RND transporter permease subunit [Gemmatimonadaceae bacterium]